MGRKTIDVVYILEECNKQLTRDDLSKSEKRAICEILETILFKTENYSGFNYNYWLSVGCNQWRDAGEPSFPEKEKYILGPSGDEWNRHYYYSSAMQEASRRLPREKEPIHGNAVADFIRITKWEARRLFAKGNETIFLCPCKMHPGFPFNMALMVSGKEWLEKAQWYKPRDDGTTSDLWKGTIEKTAWDLLYNNWNYYNTSYETGYYAHYYIQR